MAKGQIAKDVITKCILKVFDGSFINDKEIRIPFMENGELCQIKVALTCAKVNVEGGGTSSVANEAAPAFTDADREITPEEVEAVRDLIKQLNL
jgi:hypothetical protein